ncbi:MAG: aldo/keto reductase [Microbacterium gubbeenense]|uniref:aldo/keto reductase n=1 Tax=Microbacterium gubbeenense TaxID=159896 RepID=UPI003F96F274
MTESPRFHSRPLADLNRPYAAADDRYDAFEYRQVGASGLFLPPISLGLWWNFGDNIPMDNQRALLRHAFDRGITHFDLANNYGPPYGSAEKNFGRIFREDFAPYRDELIISSKAGYDMWRGPYGDWASRKYLIASAEQSLRSMNLDYVDVFYSHRPDPVTPIEETIGALDTLVKQGKALYVGISSYSAEQTIAAKAVARSLGTPLVIHQPSYSIINRWIEDGLTDALRQEGMGAIAFVPLAQGVLTNKYLGEGEAERAQQRGSLGGKRVTDEAREQLRTLDAIASDRGQTLAQMALQWVLRDGVVTSALIGASRPDQIDENVRALEGAAFTAAESDAIDRAAELIGDDFWASE